MPDRSVLRSTRGKSAISRETEEVLRIALANLAENEANDGSSALRLSLNDFAVAGERFRRSKQRQHIAILAGHAGRYSGLRSRDDFLERRIQRFGRLPIGIV